MSGVDRARLESAALGLAALGLSALGSAASAQTATGPSFDCAKARAPLERQVCADPALSQADREMAAAYRKALAAAPAAWRGRLRDTQRSWLSFVAASCTAEEIDRRNMDSTPATCRRYLFEERRDVLTRTIVELVGRRFVQLTTYRVAPSGEGEDLAQVEAVLLQIAEPSNEGERAWNAMIARRLAAATATPGATATRGEVTVVGAAPGFLNVTVNRTDARGPGGDTYRFASIPWSFRLGREITTADVFADPRAAKAAIARLAVARIAAEVTGQGERVPDEVTQAVLRDLIEEERYLRYTSTGLGLAFDDDNAFGGAHLAVAVLSTNIPWGELKSYLRKDLPFDPAALRDPE